MKHFKFILPLIFILFSCSNDSDDRVQSTQLELTILDEFNVAIGDVEVKLYASQTDYDNDTNVVTTLSTDVNGKVTFDNLQALTYYWRTNISCYLENSDYNSISPITINTLNQFSINLDSHFKGDIYIENNSSVGQNVVFTGPENGSLYVDPNTTIFLNDKNIGEYLFQLTPVGSTNSVNYQFVLICGDNFGLTID